MQWRATVKVLGNDRSYETPIPPIIGRNHRGHSVLGPEIYVVMRMKTRTAKFADENRQGSSNTTAHQRNLEKPSQGRAISRENVVLHCQPAVVVRLNSECARSSDVLS